MSGTLFVVLAITGWAVYYASACWLWPYVDCGKCKGKGKHRSLWGGKAFRLCRRCKRSGMRLRLGRRVYNFLRSKQKDASR